MIADDYGYCGTILCGLVVDLFRFGVNEGVINFMH